MKEGNLIGIISIIVTVMDTVITIIGNEKLIKLVKPDKPIIAIMISYSVYIIVLFFILKYTNKLLERSRQKGKINNSSKILKFFKQSVIASCLVVFIFKILLMYNTSRVSNKRGFIILIFLISLRIIYCLYVSDIGKINRFKHLFFINQNNIENNHIVTKQNRFYEILYIIGITMVISILTYSIAILLGIDFIEIFSEINFV